MGDETTRRTKREIVKADMKAGVILESYGNEMDVTGE